MCGRAGCSAAEFEALVQRNLGANAGLDYRELGAFLTAIVDREQAALAALLGDAADSLGAGSPSKDHELTQEGVNSIAARDDSAPLMPSQASACELAGPDVMKSVPASSHGPPSALGPVPRCRGVSAATGEASESCDDALLRHQLAAAAAKVDGGLGCCRCGWSVPEASADAAQQQGHTTASGTSRAACCPSVASAGYGSKCGSRLWQRADCVMVVMQAIPDEPRRAAVLQTLFDLRRAHSALAELQTDGTLA